MGNNIKILENLRNNFSCKKYTQSTKCCLMQDSKTIISYKLFPYFETIEPVIREILVPFSMMTLHDLEAGVKGQI